MSNYVKLFLIVVVGTIGSWLAINHLVLSTDHMSESFSVSNVPYTDGDTPTGGSATAEVTAAVIYQEQHEQTELERELELERKVRRSDGPRESNAELSELEKAALAEAEEKQAELEEDEAEEEDEEEEEEELIEIALADEEEADSDAQSGAQDNADGNGKKGKGARADSDADIQAAKNAENNPNGNNAIENKSTLLNGSSIPKKRNQDEVKTASTVQAFDLAYALPTNSKCVIPGDTYPRVGILYRPTSYAIKGQSLSSIDKMITLYKNCGGGKLVVLQNSTDSDKKEDADQRLVQLRQDEVKYYLLQRRVSKDDMIFPDNL